MGEPSKNYYLVIFTLWKNLLKTLLLYRGVELGGDGGDRSPPTFEEGGTYYILSPPTFEKTINRNLSLKITIL